MKKLTEKLEKLSLAKRSIMLPLLPLIAFTLVSFNKLRQNGEQLDQMVEAQNKVKRLSAGLNFYLSKTGVNSLATMLLPVQCSTASFPRPLSSVSRVTAIDSKTSTWSNPHDPLNYNQKWLVLKRFLLAGFEVHGDKRDWYLADWTYKS